jgi:hypothetical protein
MAPFTSTNDSLRKKIEKDLFFIHGTPAFIYTLQLHAHVVNKFPILTDILHEKPNFFWIALMIGVVYLITLIFAFPFWIMFRTLAKELGSVCTNERYLKRMREINHPFQGLAFISMLYVGCFYAYTKYCFTALINHLPAFTLLTSATAFCLSILWHKWNETVIRKAYDPNPEPDTEEEIEE